MVCGQLVVDHKEFQVSLFFWRAFTQTGSLFHMWELVDKIDNYGLRAQCKHRLHLSCEHAKMVNVKKSTSC